MTGSAVSTYQEIEIQSMSPAERIAFMYDHLLGRLQRAAMATDSEVYSTLVGNAQDTVGELLVSLDLEKGGQIANNLAAIYNFFLRELTDVMFKKDDARIAKMIDGVTQLKTAWQAVVDAASQQAAS